MICAAHGESCLKSGLDWDCDPDVSARMTGAALQRPVDAGSSAAGTTNDTGVTRRRREALDEIARISQEAGLYEGDEF